jgi:hypothetical protein
VDDSRNSCTPSIFLLKGVEKTPELLSKYVMPVYIRVSVVLSKSLCRKEREKLYITLDSMVVMLARV